MAILVFVCLRRLLVLFGDCLVSVDLVDVVVLCSGLPLEFLKMCCKLCTFL